MTKNILVVLIAICAPIAGCRWQEKVRSLKVQRFDLRPAAPKPPPPVYPHSVIPGGVQSSKDVQDAMHRDPEIARHYANLKVDALKASRLGCDTDAYVSFRKDGQIYWTGRKVHISKGEVVLSDGTEYVRGRCGNRIAWDPRGPLLPKEFREPTSAELNTPVLHGESSEELAMPPVFTEWRPSLLHYPEVSLLKPDMAPATHEPSAPGQKPAEGAPQGGSPAVLDTVAGLLGPPPVLFVFPPYVPSTPVVPPVNPVQPAVPEGPGKPQVIVSPIPTIVPTWIIPAQPIHVYPQTPPTIVINPLPPTVVPVTPPDTPVKPPPDNPPVPPFEPVPEPSTLLSCGIGALLLVIIRARGRS